MAKKKLLNEAQVRRFMSLSGIQPLSEMYGKKEEEKHDKDKMEEGVYEEEDKDKMEEGVYEEKDDEDKMEEAMYSEEEEDPKEAMMDEEEGDEAMGMEDDGDEVEIDQDMVDKANEAVASLQQLVDALGGGGGMPEEEPMADEPMADEPKADAEGEKEEDLLEALSGVNLEPTKDEIVNEVARRVAKRILKAKKAKQQLDEALGNTGSRLARQKK